MTESGGPSGAAGSPTALLGLVGAPRTRTAHQFVHDTLRRLILSGDLAGGARLVQADVAKQLGVSTTPLREALRDLATEGLIRLDPHRGAIVRELKEDEVREIYQLRRVLEPLSIRHAVERMSDEALDEAEDLARRMESQDDPGQWVDLNRRFHALFADASGLPRLQAILESLRDSAAIYVGFSIKLRPERMSDGNEDHRQLLAAFRRRDGDAAAEVELHHLDATVGALETAE
ncbi:MAG: GntR family transcriptional regulator [Actinomycetes bacterium]